MTSGPESTIMNRGLLTKAQRDLLRGEKDDVDEQAYRYRIRSDFRARMDRLEEDLELLQEGGEGDLVDEFHQRFGRYQRLEREVEELRRRLDGN